MVRKKSGPRPSAPQKWGAVGNIGFMNNLMGSPTVTFDFKPSVGIFAGKVDKLGMDIRSFHEPLKRAVKEVMIPSIQQNFNASGRPEAWAPLSDATWRTRAAQGWVGGDILLKSGALRTGMSRQNIWSITQQSATIRDIPDKIWYGKVHQAGYGGSGAKTKKAVRRQVKVGGVIKFTGGRDTDTKRGATGIPARPFALIQDEDRDAIERIFYDWLEERIEHSWGGAPL